MLKRHPFIKLLLKIVAMITVSMTTFIFCMIAFFVLFLGGLIAIAILGSKGENISVGTDYKYIAGNKESENKFLSIKVTGVILGDKSEQSNPFEALNTGVVYGYEIKKELTDAANDKTLKGVILEVNSPGGTIFGSRAIADGVMYYKQKTGKPVITFVSGLAASGGYWASIASDIVVADYGSTIGSIGVLFGPFKYYDKVVSENGGILTGGVVTQNGIDTTYITAGKSKDIGNPYRQLTIDEIKILQRSVNDEYDNFVGYVSKRRHIPESTIRNQLGALIYDNKMAKENKLIDATMNRDQAYTFLANKAHISEGNYQIISRKNDTNFVDALLQSQLKTPAKSVSAYCILSTITLAYHGDVSNLCQ